MDVNTVTTLIGSVGFPIFACLAMGWYVKYTTDNNNKRVSELTEEHKKEMSEVTVALNNNTLAITKLCERLGNKNDI